MPGHRISAEVLHAVQTARPPVRRDRRPSLPARVAARIRAHTYDSRLSVGMPTAPTSSLKAHRDRLRSSKERHAVAQTLRDTVDDALDGTVSIRIPLNAADILGTVDLIERIAQHLDSAEPACERGVARLRLLLSDGRGPLYLHGRGDLRGRLGAALAAL